LTVELRSIAINLFQEDEAMSVGRICVRSVDSAEMSETAILAARRMRDRNVGSLVVVDRERHPLGLITDRDLAVRVLAEGRDATQTLISEVMTRLPHTVREETPIEEALGLMRSGACRRLPVVDQDRRLVGVLCLDDVLDLLAEEFGEVRTLLRKESSESLAAVQL
jgi:CBS domain-containing protein